MEPILSKEEISDLLTAIKDGRLSVDSLEENKPYRPIPPATRDVDLFQIYVHEKSAETRIPNLDLILDAFANYCGVSLTNRQQKPFAVQRLAIETSSFQDAILALKDKGAVGIFSFDPLKYDCLFHVDPQLSFALLEIMLGASSKNAPLALERQLTAIEVNVLKNTLEIFGADMRRAFKTLIEVEPKLVKVENNFRLVNIVDGETEMLVVRFKIKTGNQNGEMRFMIPYLALEPLRDRFRDFVTVARTSSSWGAVFASEILHTSADLTARSGLVRMTVREILALQPGDIVDIGYDPDLPLTVLVEDKPKFTGIPGIRNGKQAIHITGFFSPQTGEQHGVN